MSAMSEIETMPPALPDHLLALRHQLPLKPAPVTLAGRYVQLAPLSPERDAEPLYRMSNGEAAAIGGRSVGSYDSDALIWRYMPYGPFANLGDFHALLQRLCAAPDSLCLCVFYRVSGATLWSPVGVVNFINNSPQNLKIELGGIWYSPLAQRTNANTEATYLMLNHAFDLGYQRLEWKCHSLNERSRRAALRMGFKFEGIQERHMIVKGRSRDTAWFRILHDEWPVVKAHLERLLYGNVGA
jgi:RimJ/RimL family protein N-acetyltransferase